MKKYCPTCGKPNPAAANFCCACGSGMKLSLSSEKGKKSLTPQSLESELEDSDEEEEESFTLTANRLDIEIEFNDPEPKESIEQIVARGGPVGSTYKRSGGPEKSKEEFLKEFEREAGPLRKGDQSVDKTKEN
jgi:hypothetical protein